MTKVIDEIIKSEAELNGKSPEYLEGVRAQLMLLLLGSRLVKKYPGGSAQADAFNAGILHGSQLAHDHCVPIVDLKSVTVMPFFFNGLDNHDVARRIMLMNREDVILVGFDPIPATAIKNKLSALGYNVKVETLAEWSEGRP